MEYEIAAVTEAGAAATYENYTGNSLDNLKRAKKYRHFLEVIEELVSEKKHSTVEINQLTP